MAELHFKFKKLGNVKTRFNYTLFNTLGSDEGLVMLRDTDTSPELRRRSSSIAAKEALKDS